MFADAYAQNALLFSPSPFAFSALTLIQRDGYKWRTVNGWNFWMFENETVAERLNNILEEQVTEEDE